LSDIFSSKPQLSSPAKSKQTKTGPLFTIAQDAKPAPPPAKEQPSRSQADSGYHGSQDEMEVDAPVPSSTIKATTQVPLKEAGERQSLRNANDVLTQEGSFHSAKEEQTAKITMPTQDAEELVDEVMQDAAAETIGQDQATEEQHVDEHELDTINTPSDASTPDRPVLRKKSSLTFAALPAREPLKTSIGARVSRISHLDQSRPGPARSSCMGRNTGGQQIRQSEAADEDDDEEDESGDGSHIEILGRDDSDSDTRATKLHNKSSTQRLHDKISMLGKAPPPRPSKSIPSAATLAAENLRKSEAASRIDREGHHEDDDSWIKPLKSPESNRRPQLTKSHTADVMEGIAGSDADESENEEEFDVRAPELIAYEERLRTPQLRVSPSPKKAYSIFHQKSASTATLVSPGKAAMQEPPSPARTISHPNARTTPKGSPSRMMAPLSASKSKLQSIMKTAKGLFSSSASVSAAAKMETLSPKALQMAAKNMPGLYPNMQALLENKPLPSSPPKEERRTRSSTEKEKGTKQQIKDSKAMQKMEEQLEKARQQEQRKASQYSIDLKPQPQPTRVSPRRQPEQHFEDEQISEVGDMAPPPAPHQSKLSRPTKPTREPITKSRPQPVAIRVGTLSQRNLPTTSLASANQESLQAEPKRPGLSKKTSTASLSSNTGYKLAGPSHTTKPRALLAAERKKEQDEREAQRKLEQRKEIERKRAAQQEETKRQEQTKRAEVERKERERVAAEQAKRQAQQQAIEKKRLENAKKAEQIRADRAAAEAPRPASRMGSAQPLNRSVLGQNLPTNPAKPAKRPMDDEAGPSRPQPPRFGGASQQADAKRRRTEDEDAIQPAPPRPTMSGAPVRQSNLGKKPSIFTHGAYAPAPPAGHMGQLSQFPQSGQARIAHATTMAQYGNGAKIPFAEVANPPQHANKTPGSAYAQHKVGAGVQLVKSSPQYQNGESIHLPEIPTDSEDDDSDAEPNGFPVPDWATPGHLTDQLLQQETLDGDAVFGPIAPLKMEEIFAKGNKERLKRMRDRTSSANWAMSGDGLTLEEVRHDREMRERMRQDGGWRYGNGTH
jgi:hypothetical protein